MARYAFHEHAVLVQLTVAHVVQLVHEVISLPQSSPKREHEDVEDDCRGNSEHERDEQHVLVTRHIQNSKRQQVDVISGAFCVIVYDSVNGIVLLSHASRSNCHTVCRVDYCDVPLGVISTEVSREKNGPTKEKDC